MDALHVRHKADQATIAQQQARIEEEHAAALQVWESLSEAQQALAAEWERAKKAEGMVQWWKEEARHMEDVLQAEREKSAHYRTELDAADMTIERLEALAGLATSTAEEFRARGRKVYDSTPDAWTEDKALAFALNGWEWDWLQRYDALTTQAPEAGQ
jgi:hypothetical protein